MAGLCWSAVGYLGSLELEVTNQTQPHTDHMLSETKKEKLLYHLRKHFVTLNLLTASL